MTMPIANLLLDVLVMVLLGLTIGYCAVLNRRIKVLQDSKSELAQLLNHFDESTQRASESIIALQTASKKIGENIQFRIDKANYMLEDLGEMIESGGKLASQMEASLAVSRARTRVLAEDMPAEPRALPSRPQPPKETPALVAERPPEKPQEKNHRDRTAASLEAVLERVVARKAPEEDSRAKGREQPRPRSRAEQELLDMIKAGVKG